MADSLVGSTGQPFRLVVELGKIREFAKATKSSNPAYAGEPGDTPLTPATFLMSMQHWQPRDANPFPPGSVDLKRILHGEQEFVFHGEPPRAGAVLTAQARIDKVFEKEGKRGGSMKFIEVVTEFRDESGRLVAESRGTSIETSAPAKES